MSGITGQFRVRRTTRLRGKFGDLLGRRTIDPWSPVVLTLARARRSGYVFRSMRSTRPNRLQVVVVAFLLLAWIGLVVILALAPDTYDRGLRLPSGGSGLGELVFLVALSAFIVLVIVGVLRRWRWMFWLLLIAFLAGVLRVPASIAEGLGWLPATGPGWYVVVQAVIGVVQFAIGIAMFVEFRRHGVWGLRT